MVYVMSQNELYHHGILGMKWGKRQGPPYPLDGKQHSAAEKKAGWQKSLDKASSKLSKEAESGKRHGSTARAIKKALNKTDDAVTRAIYDKQVAENLKIKKLGINPIADTSKYDMAIERTSKIIAEGEKRTWQLMADSAFAGYSVDSKKVLKYVDRGRDAAIMSSGLMFGFVGGVASVAGYAALDAFERKQTGVRKEVEGNKFNIKKTKTGETPRITIAQDRAKGADKIDEYNRKAREKFSEEKRLADKRRKESLNSKPNKDHIYLTSTSTIDAAVKEGLRQNDIKMEKLRRAKTKDSFDRNFIETVQNSSNYDNKEWMMKQYSKYLDNPEKYVKKYKGG